MYCCVPFCKSNARKPTKPKTSFHEFPCDENLRRQWLRRIARKDFIINDKSNSSVVCSKHFTQNDFSTTSYKYARLKKQAVPTIFPMYPSYALLPPPDNYLALGSLNHVKRPSVVKDKAKNSRKKAVIDVVVKPDMNSTNNVVEQQHVERVTIKTAKEYTPDLPAANNSRSLVSLNHVKRTSKVETATENLSKIIPVEPTLSSMTSTNNYSREEQPEDCACITKKAKNNPPVANNNCSSISLIHMKRPFMERTKSSTKIVPINISVDSEITSTNNNLREEQHEDHACIIKKGKKDPHAAKINRSCVSLTPVKRPSLVATVTENLTKTVSVDLSFNCGKTATNKNSRGHPEDRIFTIQRAKKDILTAKNNRSCVNLNHVNFNQPSTVATVTENSTQIIPVDITINSDMTSKNNNSQEQQSKDHVFRIKKAKKNLSAPNINTSCLSLNQVKGSSMVEDETHNSTKKALIDTAVNSHMTSTNNCLVKLQHKECVFTIKTVMKDPPAANNNPSSVILFYVRKPSTVGTVTENSRIIDPVDINVNSDMTSTNNNNLHGQLHEDHACMLKKAKKDPSAANINHSCVSLNRMKRPSMVETVTENSTKIGPLDIAFSSGMTFTNNNNLREQHEDHACMIKTVNPSAANINRSGVNLIPMKRPSMETSTNNNFIEQQHNDDESAKNSITFVLQTKVRDQQKQIKRLRNLLWKKNQKLKIMKEEMNMIKEKVSFYENNFQYKILRKALTLKENCSQTNIIVDQL